MVRKSQKSFHTSFPSIPHPQICIAFFRLDSTHCLWAWRLSRNLPKVCWIYLVKGMGHSAPRQLWQQGSLRLVSGIPHTPNHLDIFPWNTMSELLCRKKLGQDLWAGRVPARWSRGAADDILGSWGGEDKGGVPEGLTYGKEDFQDIGGPVIVKPSCVLFVCFSNELPTWRQWGASWWNVTYLLSHILAKEP